MPTYEYVCQSCGHRFDVWQKISDEPIQTCPVCGSVVRRVIFPVGLMFKGPGFYSTDSRGTATVASGHSDDAPAKAGDDSKPAAAKTSEPKTGESKTGESKAAAPATSKSSTTHSTSE